MSVDVPESAMQKKPDVSVDSMLDPCGLKMSRSLTVLTTPNTLTKIRINSNNFCKKFKPT